jgi:hypothetical protein
MFALTRSLSLAAALAAGLTPNLATGASAASPAACGAHDKVVDALKAKYQEERRVMGVINAQTVMEIFMSPKGTWTVLVTDTTGTSCMTASGEDWQEVPVTVAGLDS